MTARPEAPTLDECIRRQNERCEPYPFNSPIDDAIFGYLKHLRSIEQAAGMPNYPVTTTIFIDNKPYQFIDVTDYDKLLDHCLHLKDKLAKETNRRREHSALAYRHEKRAELAESKLARMEALMREPDEEMIQAGDAGCAKEFGGKEWRTKFVVGEFSIHAESAYKAMSAALLAKLEKEK